MYLKNTIITFTIQLDAIELPKEMDLQKARQLLFSLAEEQVYEKMSISKDIIDCPSYPALITR